MREWMRYCSYIGITDAAKMPIFPCDNLQQVKVNVAQSCPMLCNPMDCSPWNSPGHNTGVGNLSLLQDIFPTRGSSQPRHQPRSSALQADSLPTKGPRINLYSSVYYLLQQGTLHKIGNLTKKC